MGKIHLIMSTIILLTGTEIVITVLTKTPHLHQERKISSLAEVTIQTVQMGEELVVRIMTISSISLIKMYLNRIQV